MAERSYEPREAKLLYEWMVKTFPNCLQWRHVRMGPIPKNEALYGILRRWIDGVVYDKKTDTVYLIEAKIRPEPGAISQLLLYKQLFPKTPEFEALKDKPIKLVFLTSFMDKEVKALCDQYGIEFVVYSPDWVKEYWQQKVE